EKAGLCLEELKKQSPRIAHLAFERIRKRMTTIHEAGNRQEAMGNRVVACSSCV
ncbi:MAG: hypothetical protein HY266_07985, partial [Deltaproteobacteria bacterium]|nr:hypothetical protein [Deltaproteobacteria bacterium]